MISNFEFWPNCVIIGEGKAKQCYDYINGITKLVLFTDKNLSKTAYFHELANAIQLNKIDLKIYSDIKENPDQENVADAVSFMKKIKPEALICYGGGSVIDLAKAANLMYTHDGDIREYEDTMGGIEKIKNVLLPLVAIPTTAGTGSEVSSVSVITDSINQRKMALISKYLTPTISILDVNALKSIPPILLAYTGVDALTHCIEAYISNVPFDPGKGFSIQGIRLIHKYIRRAVFDQSDVEAREKMLIASACGGMAFNNNFLGTVHACAHQLSTLANIPHGLANSIMLLPVLKWNKDVCICDYQFLAQLFDNKIDDKSAEESSDLLIASIDALINDLKIPRRLSLLGVKINQLDILAEKAYNDHNNLTNPRKDAGDVVSKQLLKQLYLEAF